MSDTNSTDAQMKVQALWKQLLESSDAQDWPTAEALFNEARIYAKSQNMRFMDLHLLYANYLHKKKEFARSLVHLEFLQSIYLQLIVTEASFLGIRGVPFFEDYLIAVEQYLQGQEENKKDLSLLNNLVGGLDYEGEEKVQKLISQF